MKSDLVQGYYVKYKLYLFPLIVGLVAIVVSYFVIYPQITKYINGRDEVKRKADRIERLTTKVKALETLDTSGIDSKLDITLQALPADRDLANLIGLVQRIASDNGVILVALGLGSTGEKGAKFNPFTVRLEVGGSKDSFKNFVNKLEQAPRVMKVASLELSPSRASESASANAIIELYFAPTPKELGAVDAPVPTISDKEEEVITKLESNKLPELPQAPGVPTEAVPKGKPNPFQ